MLTRLTHETIPIVRVEASAYTIPTDAPEADGTIEWNSTTLVLVEVTAGGEKGIGWTYADATAAQLINHKLADLVEGLDAFDVPAAWAHMTREVRNVGRPGIAATAISAVDAALWDLKARLLDQPLCKLFGMVRTGAPIYGSGGFTTYSIARLREQLGGWVASGIPRVKMKVGTHPAEDPARVKAAREAIGPQAELFVDANGAYGRKQALTFAETFAGYDVSWFEEPVSSDDLEGLRLMRDRAPASMDIAAGEYAYDFVYVRRMIEAGAVDVIQVDATRACGLTGFLKAAAVAEAHMLPLSSHCAPMLHLHVACATQQLRHMEYFHDHVRIEHMLFDGVPLPKQGVLYPDLGRSGIGLEFKRVDAARYAI